MAIFTARALRAIIGSTLGRKGRPRIVNHQSSTVNRLPGVTWQVWLLGGLRIVGSAGLISLPGGRARTLLAYLLLHPRASYPREGLADLLWPEAAPGAARRSLSNLLYVLRQAVGPGLIGAGQEAIGLATDATLWVDVWEFERLVGLTEPSALARAVELYASDLLPELYDDWLAAPRAALRDRYLAALMRLAELAASERPAEAAERYRRLLELDPLHEEAVCGLMRCLARLGRRGEALTAYASLTANLASELGVAPDAATRQLAEELGRADPGPTPRSAGPAFVGRTAERATLIARLEQARAGHGGLTALLGESGVGKTRLLGELARAASWRGWQVIWASQPQGGDPAPAAPLATALAAALAGPRLAQIASTVQPLWLDMLAGLIPGLRAAAPMGARRQGYDDPRWLPVALGHVLTALAGVAPHLLILDDMQWADPALWLLLDSLRAPLAGAPLLLVVCGRSEEAPAAVWATLAGWDATGTLCLRLAAMTEAEIAELVAAVGHPPLASDGMAHLAQASGGNPLLALALLSGADQARGQPMLAVFFQRRMAGLSAAASTALAAASVMGTYFRYALWERLVAADRPLADLALELEQAGLLIPAPDGYRFAHDTLRTYLYGQMDAPARRELHRRACAACADDPLVRLYHASAAGETALAALAALAAAERELDALALPAARRHFEQALELLPADDLSRRYRAVRGQLAALAVSDHHGAALTALAALDRLALQLGDPRYEVEAATLRADRCLRSGDVAAAQAAAEHARALAAETGLDAAAARALELIAQIAQQRGDYHAAQTHLLIARARYEAAGNLHGAATTAHNLALVAWAVGEHQDALAGYARAAASFSAMGDLLNQARALNGLGCACWGLGDYRAARAHHEQALAICHELSDRWGELSTILNLGQVALALGDYVAAIDRFAIALTGFRTLGQQAGTAAALSNLAQAYALMGDRAAARSYAAEALRASQAAGLLRLEGYAQHNHGLALLIWEPLRDPSPLGSAEAAAAFMAACAIRERLGERENLAESQACLALALVVTDPEGARRAWEAAMAALMGSADRPTLRQLVAYAGHITAHTEADAQPQLRMAAVALSEAADGLSEAERACFLQQVPLNRATLGALAARSRYLTVRLVRAEIPRGQVLSSADYRAVRWTVASPADEAIPRADERRRHILRRLLAEAADQGAAPTDTDLAEALGVSRRTILRDMAHLTQEGSVALTRHRRTPR